MQIDDERRITRFVEKPKDPAVQDSLAAAARLVPQLGHRGRRGVLPGLDGHLRFQPRRAAEAAGQYLTDFGKHIIPGAIKTHRVFSYIFQGYWEDIGTIRTFFEANLDLTTELPRFNFFDMGAPIFTRPALSARRPKSTARRSTTPSFPTAASSITRRSSTASSASAAWWAPAAYLQSRDPARAAITTNPKRPSAKTTPAGRPRIGIGKNTRIENAIIDKNARIGDNCFISPAGKPENVDHPLYYIRDGIVIIPKNGIIPHGTRI